MLKRLPCWVSTIVFLPAAIVAVSFLAIVPHYGDLFEIGFEQLQVASEEPLKVWHLVENHPSVVGGADIFWHIVFEFCSAFYSNAYILLYLLIFIIHY
jgi:hypothetical protein